MLHTREDWEVVLADLRLSGGQVYTLYNKECLTALAVASPTDEGGWRLHECVSDTPEEGERLLQAVCRRLGVDTLEVEEPVYAVGEGEPLGMLRIIHAEGLLERYAARHPERELCFCLTDELLPVNNGCYHLSGGVCKKSAARPVGDLATLSIVELAELLFADQCPYMSLMLN